MVSLSRRISLVLFTWFALFGLQADTARPARADLASSLYDDVRDVIEELIQSEIADGVVRNLEREAPGVAFYFHDTLERLASPYWGSLPKVLKQDVNVVVADFVYFHLSAEGDVSSLDGSARRFFSCAIKGETKDPACLRMRGAIEQGRPLLDVECRRAAPDRDRRVACDLGFAALSALEGRSHTRRHVIDAIADMVLSDVDEPAASLLREVLVDWLDHPSAVPQSLLQVFADPTLQVQLSNESLDKVCGDLEQLRAYVEDGGKFAGWACFAVSHKKLPDALQLRVIVDEGPGNHVGVTLPFWTIMPLITPIGEPDFGDNALYGALAAEAFEIRCREAERSPEIASKWPCTGPRLGPTATVQVKFLAVTFDAKIDATGKLRGAKPKLLAYWMRRWKRTQATIIDIHKSLPPQLGHLLFVPDLRNAQTASLLRAAARMPRLLQGLRQRWYLWSEENQDLANLDIGELLELTRDTVAESAKELGSAGRIVGRLGAVGARDLSDMFRLIVQADHRTLATDTLRAGFGLAADQAGDPEERFFLTLTAYLLDAADGDTMGVTRSAFRAAAKDLLRRAETRGVPGADARLRLNVFPRLGLRVVFNEANAVVLGDDTRRTVVSVEWPTAMLAFSDFAGMELSVIDAVAPLGELAMRPAGTYMDEKLVLLDAVRPRAGVWLAVPQLSKRLELSAGVGARLIGVDATGGGDTPLTATYVRRTSITVDAGLGFVF